MSAPRQTLSFLRRRLDEVGLRPRTRHGQNFLVDLNLLEVLVSAGELDRHDVVLEVGTGTGSLTARLAAAAGEVITVEVDDQLHQLASEELADASNVTMLQCDALKNKNRLNPMVLEAIEQRLAARPGARLKLAANLPYNIATPLITNLLALDRSPELMAVTIQKELADRLAARPSTKDYGALSVWVQSQCEVELVREMPPTVFWPRPKVSSAIVQLRLVPELRDRIAQQVGDRDYFHHFVRAMFFHRRKFLRAELLSFGARQLDKPTVDGILSELDLPPNTRAEQLDVAAMLRLCAAVRTRLGD